MDNAPLIYTVSWDDHCAHFLALPRARREYDERIAQGESDAVSLVSAPEGAPDWDAQVLAEWPTRR